MSIKAKRARDEQRELLHPRPRLPAWQDLPETVRSAVRELVVLMLAHHAGAADRLRARQGASDE